MKRKFFVTVPLVLMMAGLGLSGCSSSSVPKPVAVTPSPQPALSEEKLASINDSIYGAIKKADGSLKTDDLSSRLSGPALVERRMDYQKKALLGEGAGELPVLSGTVKQAAVSQASTYPRIVIEVMEAPDGENLQRLNVLVQQTARHNWTLWGAMQILPTSVAPMISTGETGAVFIEPDDSKGLVASPNAVVDAYIKTSQTRKEVKGFTFAEDSFRERLAQSQDKNAKTVKELGKSTLEFSRGAEGPFSVRTKDGGALVITEINFTSKITITKNGGKATIPENHDISIASTGKANKKLEFGKSVASQYTAALAFYVPPKKAKDSTITLIASSPSAPFKVDVQ